MENSCKRKMVFSSSGISPFRRYLEMEREFVKGELGKKISFENVLWSSEMSLDDFMTAGHYIINGCRISSADGMPIMNSGQGEEIAALLIVTDSLLPEHAADNRIIGQTMILSNRVGGETKIYTRSLNITANEKKWSKWQVLQGMTELGTCDNVDTCIDNGLYSGVLCSNESTLLFILVVINNYVAATQSGAPRSISQLMYAIDMAGGVSVKYRSKRGDAVWELWKNIIGGDNPGAADLSEMEKLLYENRTGIMQETARATTAETVMSEKIAQMDETLLRLMQKSFPLTVKLSYTPAAAINEYTGKEKEFTFSWTCSIDGVTLPQTDIEGGTISYDTHKISLPAGTASYKIALIDTATIALELQAQGMTASASARVLFGHRWYSGVVDTDFLLDEASLMSLLQQGVASGKTATITYSAFSLKKIVYAYAAKYGLLTGIVDANNINLLSNYSHTTKTIGGVEYNVYISTEEFSVAGNVTYKYQ